MAAGSIDRLLGRYGPVLVLLVLGTVALVVVLVRGGVDPSQVGRVYLLSVGALALFCLVQELRRRASVPFQKHSAPSSPGAQLPPDLARLQDSLRASRISPGGYERQVVPLLREVAVDRLLLIGISLNGEPQRAAESLGPQLAAALLEERTDVGRSLRQGPRQRELQTLVDALEAVGR